MLKANYGYILVEVEENPDVTPGGIVLPKNAVEESNKGVVISDGNNEDHLLIDEEDDDDFESLGLKGFTVFFPRYIGHKVEHNGKTYLVIKSEDILAYVTKAKD